MGRQAAQFRFDGGLNEEDPQFTQKPGVASVLTNFECLPGGGYRRVSGYDTWYGAHIPLSDLSYRKIGFTNGSSIPPVNGEDVLFYPSINTVARVIGYELTSGTWGIDAAGWLIVSEDGVFADPAVGDVIRLDGLEWGSPTTIELAQFSDANYYEWIARSRDDWRRKYGTTAGNSAIWGGSDLATGPVLGMFIFEGVLYAWRALLADPTKQGLFKLDWSFAQVPFGKYLSFSTGTADIAVGDTITGATSGATALVIDVNVAGGNNAGPTYTNGRIFVDNVTGVWQVGEVIRVGANPKAICASTLTTPAPNVTGSGRTASHDTVSTNFYGADDRAAVYGCDGVNNPYWFDGTRVMPFSNGMTTPPTSIEAHRNHLFLAYDGGSLQNSATGLPLVWSVRQGAAEIGLGDDPVNMRSYGNNALVIVATNSVHVLTGNSDQDWNLRIIEDELNVIPSTLSPVGGQTLFLDRGGVMSLEVNRNGDYGTTQISRVVRKTLDANKDRVLFSVADQEAGQFILFFNDKSVLVATFFGGKLVGWSKRKYAHQMVCGTHGMVDGKAALFLADEDGWVYSVTNEPSFAGSHIESVMQSVFSYHGMPNRNKRYHKITLEMETEQQIDLRLRMDYDYGAGSQVGNWNTSTGITGGKWDASLWDRFYWDSGVITAPEVNIDGVSRSASLVIYNRSRVAPQFVLSAALLQFSGYGERL